VVAVSVLLELLDPPELLVLLEPEPVLPVSLSGASV
jgi:hypothetical protein